MRDVQTRQQALLAAALFCAAAMAFSAETGDADPIVRELQNLMLQQVALSTTEGTEDAWKKLGEDYEGLVGRHPKNAAIRDAHGEFLWERNDRDGAFREWLAGERIDPKNANILRRLAGAFLAQGDPRAALGYYTRATAAEPGNAPTHFNLANVAFLFRHGVGKPEQDSVNLALKHFAEAHRLAPENPDYARGYAETFYLLPRPDWQTALRIWTNYLNLVTEKNFAFLNLARVHMKLGDAENARACLAQVVGPGSERLKNRLLERIEKELLSEKGANPPEAEKTAKPFVDESGKPP